MFTQYTVKTMTGTGTMKISPKYVTNVITINGLAIGTATIRAKEASNDVFEDVTNGSVYLPEKRTIIIECVQLKEIEVTVAPSGTFDVIVTQYHSHNEPQLKNI